MSKKLTIIIAIAITAVLLFSACERSASQPTKATPTTKGAKNTPLPTNILLLQSWETVTANYVQTAVALGTFTAAPVTPTPQFSPTPTQLGAPTETPTPTSLVPATGVPTNTPVPVTTPLATVAPLIRPSTYTLLSGEYPYCIARRYNFSQSELMSLNGLAPSQATNLPVGYILQIPQTGNQFVGPRTLLTHPAQYTVSVNDTIYKIACAFGDVDPASIAAANGIAVSSPLTTGQILNIP